MSLPNFLINGYKHWKNQSYLDKKDIYKKLSKGPQKPKAMIISCCDSRIQVNSILNGEIGDYFVHKNIANIVYPYLTNEKDNATSSAIEYAVKALKVPTIIVFGHSNCGGIEYAYKKNLNFYNQEDYHFINKWVEIIKKICNIVPNNLSEKEKLNLLELENIKNSLKNLLSFPFVKQSVDNQTLKLYGLWFDIETGELKYIDINSKKFEKLSY